GCRAGRRECRTHHRRPRSPRRAAGDLHRHRRRHPDHQPQARLTTATPEQAGAIRPVHFQEPEMAKLPRDDFRFFHPLRVRWAEVDPQGIVFNGNYLTYADVAITEYFRAMDVAYPADLLKDGGDFFAVKTLLEYLAPARFDDLLDIGVRVSRLGGASMT